MPPTKWVLAGHSLGAIGVELVRTLVPNSVHTARVLWFGSMREVACFQPALYCRLNTHFSRFVEKAIVFLHLHLQGDRTHPTLVVALYGVMYLINARITEGT